jgi:molecular chaperone GrpE
LTEDRENDGTGQQPESDDVVPNQPLDSPEGDDALNELEELVPDVPETREPIPVPEPLDPTAGPAASPDPLGEASANDDAAGLRKRIEAKDAQLAQVMTAYRGLKKETERLRKRIETHQKRRFEQSKNDFIGHFVEVLDNLDRAIDSIESNFDSDAVLEGIILVRSRLVQLLREEGLEKIFVGGQSFDPTHSEAAGIEPVDDASQDNVVLKELQRGYMLKGALLRPARVIVGRFSRAGREDTNDAGKTPTDSPPALDEGDDANE